MNVDLVAPAMTLPSASHSYDSAAPDVQVPCFAVSVDPTATVPDTVGVAAVSGRVVTAAVDAETRDTGR
ncbi:hypothetical protein [Microbacterium elymi]|uniref:Uncharacterized protein n=1 Tax=Microbacterium elymi TaxID=2909587 RepID=A0ABY5NL60_9MICO|nr:hypothetical protein [Microbacterium elymi]UUT35851.1 hypothetical protein L2X98_22015 [Microbacterium elymi]